MWMNIPAGAGAGPSGVGTTSQEKIDEARSAACVSTPLDSYFSCLTETLVMQNTLCLIN